MTRQEREKLEILNTLGKKRLTTFQLMEELKNKLSCPDDLARTLNIMRRKGLIKGEVSQEKGGWVWWVEE